MTTDQIQKAIEAIRECKEYESRKVPTAQAGLCKARVKEFNRILGVLNTMFREAGQA